jgi:hypothetical protein
MSKKSVVSEAQEIQLAIELIQLGARLQLLEAKSRCRASACSSCTRN